METPICDFIKEYNKKQPLRLHMPGHKGSVNPSDITEVEGADVLYHSEGIIKESQKNASLLFGTGKTVYSAEGSSLAIRAMLFLVMLYAKKNGLKKKILAGRNAHKTYLTASALLDFETEWIFPESGGILSCEITPEILEERLIRFKQTDEMPAAVYITSPDYLGNISDIKNISSVCRKYNTLLIVDNAHGAYLKFLPEDIHPITLGADMCCDSAHKTLPVLTGGAYLHISENAPSLFSLQAENAMSVFASTSPSYLILESLDRANKYMAEGFKEKLSDFSLKALSLKKELKIPLAGNEPLKLTLKPKAYGYTGTELAGILQEKNIICEFYDPDYVVMMLSYENGDGVFDKIKNALSEIPPKDPILTRPPEMAEPYRCMSEREAIFSAGEIRSVDDCVGKILSSPSVSCPPAIPIVVCGELITEDAVKLFKYYGIDKCNVII